ncbi:GntR family transcriptional regulator [Mycolicibacterium sp. CBM1]
MAVEGGAHAEQPADEGGTMWAYQQVRKAILCGDLAPGARVSQVQLANSLGIGRPALREALRLLQNEGLITAELNRQVRVAPLELADFEQLNALRLAVEPMAVRLSVPHLTEEDLVTLVAAEAENSHFQQLMEFDAAAVAHHCFHATIYSRAGERIRRLADDLWQSAERYRRLMGGEQSNIQAVTQLINADHAAILRAALSRDAVGCADLVAQHINKASTITLSIIDSTHDSSTLRTAADHVLNRSTTKA